MQKRLLYFNPSSAGGLADYAHEQATALVESEVAVEMLVTARYRVHGDCEYQIRRVLVEAANASGSRLARKLSWAKCLLKNFRTLACEARNENMRTVLFGAYAEYLAPLWAGQFRSLAALGVKFGAVVHDPVRDFMLGPRWWHWRSIADAYSFLTEAFVHEKIVLETVRPVPALRTTVIPHGPFCFPDPTQSREQVRQSWHIPDHAFVLLSFGHIRDGKNLDLVIRALADLSSVYLVVAGKEQSSGQKSVAYYQDLARTMGVYERCRWIHGHVPETGVGNLFAGSDIIMLTYSKDFHSASGVLNVAVRYRKACVASSGGGNLQSVVERFNLGCFIAPDDLGALKTGIENAMRGRVNPQWDIYELENSWRHNAQLVKEKMFDEDSIS